MKQLRILAVVVCASFFLFCLALDAEACGGGGGRGGGGGGRGGGGFGGGGRGGGGFGGGVISGNIGGLHVAISPEIFLMALGVGLVLALLASIVPVWYIARVRPAEVLRNE